MGKRRVRTTKLAAVSLIAASFCFSLIIAEAIYRVFERVKPGLQHDDAARYGRIYLRDPYLGWRNRPSIKESWTVGTCTGEVEFDVNGDRVGTNPTGLPEGTPTILFVGDSMVAGFEVPGDRTMAAYARRELLKHNLNVRVVNAGVRGYSTLQMKRNMELLIERFHPLHVIVLSSGNDVWENVWPYALFADGRGWVIAPGFALRSSPPYSIDESIGEYEIQTFRGLVRLPWKIKLASRLCSIFHLVRPLLAPRINRFNKKMRSQFWNEMYDAAVDGSKELTPTQRHLFEIWEFSLKQIALAARDKGADVTFLSSLVSIPTGNRYDPILSRVSQQTGARHLPIAGRYKSLFDPTKRECTSDGHYVAYEHELIAKLVVDDIFESVSRRVGRSGLSNLQ